MADKLTKLGLKYGTDKCPPGQSFTPYYHNLFKNMDVKKILEIGIGHPGTMQHMPGYKAGASLRMWRDYFPKATVYACDIRKDILITENRIKSYYCDQGNAISLKNLIKKIGNNFDIIIDDGSHKTEHQILSAKILIPIVKKGGFYIIEDVKEPGRILDEIPSAIEIPFLQSNDFDDRLVVIHVK